MMAHNDDSKLQSPQQGASFGAKRQLQIEDIDVQDNLQIVSRKEEVDPKITMTKQQLGALINDCESLQLHTIQNLNKFEVERFNQSQINQKLDMAIDMLKDLDNIDTNMVQTLFEYQKLIKSQLQDTMTQVNQ